LRCAARCSSSESRVVHHQTGAGLHRRQHGRLGTEPLGPEQPLGHAQRDALGGGVVVVAEARHGVQGDLLVWAERQVVDADAEFLQLAGGHVQHTGPPVDANDQLLFDTVDSRLQVEGGGGTVIGLRHRLRPRMRAGHQVHRNAAEQRERQLAGCAGGGTSTGRF
jgi:hypothetical protein